MQGDVVGVEVAVVRHKALHNPAPHAHPHHKPGQAAAPETEIRQPWEPDQHSGHLDVIHIELFLWQISARTDIALLKHFTLS